MSKGILYIMSGPSGTGKGTICNEIIKRRDINLSVSVTSRDKRVGEIAGVTYNYISVDEFRKLIEDEKMLEWAMYGENYYGTPKENIEKMLDEGKDVLLEIEVQGALQVKAKMPEAVMMFIVPPSMEVLKKRLIDRGRETEDEINTRIKTAQAEFAKSFQYNDIIVNDDLEECVNKVMSLMDGYTKSRKIVENLLNE